MNQNPIMDFRAALERAGLCTDDPIIADGKLHRFHVTGDKPGTRNGWYVLHANGIPAGKFGSWKEGVTHSWCSKLNPLLSPVEHARTEAQVQCGAGAVRSRVRAPSPGSAPQLARLRDWHRRTMRDFWRCRIKRENPKR